MLVFANINVVKLLLCLILSFTNIIGGVGYKEDIYFTNQSVNSICIYKNGSEIKLSSSNDKYNEIITELNNILGNSREMPAFGVSLHNETVEAIKSGIWLELVFDKEYKHNGMPYSKLLIQIEPNWTGINLIRYHSSLYEGRCFYFDLGGNNTTDLYNLLNNINL